MDANKSPQHSTKRFPVVTLTRQGFMYLTVNLILLLTAINYSNHNILMVALFLLSLLVVSFFMSLRRMRGVALSVGEVKPVFLGQDAYVPVTIRVTHAGDAVPVEITLVLDSGQEIDQAAQLPDAESGIERIHFSPGKRGRYNLISVGICSSFPFKLFRIGRVFPVSQSFWVYATPVEELAARGVHKNRRGSERSDTVFLRQYRLGDPVRRIHKKSLAMGQGVLVKDVEARAPDSHWVKWDGLSDLTTEQRLRILTRQVLDADQRGRSYGLALPGRKISPAVGEAHKHQCLRALAEF